MISSQIPNFQDFGSLIAHTNLEGFVPSHIGFLNLFQILILWKQIIFETLNRFQNNKFIAF
jgi:hypothetical protein